MATFLTLPLLGHLMAVQLRLRKKSIAITDRRVKLMNEILQGIKAVKVYAWEKPFSAQVQKERAQEVKILKENIWAKSIFMAIMFSTPLLIAVSTFAYYRGIFRQYLEPAAVFTGISLLNALREPVMMIPWVAPALIDTRIAIKRIERFSSLEDIDDYARKNKATEKKSDNNPTDSSSQNSDEMNEAVGTVEAGQVEPRGKERYGHNRVENATFKWGKPVPSLIDPPKPKKNKFNINFQKKNSRSSATEENDKSAATIELMEETAAKTRGGNALEDISLGIPSSQLTDVISRVGAGKSSLSHAILGEMRKVNGKVALTGSVAYVAQTACIFNDTLRNNILFGKEYDEKLYRRAIRVSALSADIAVLPGGDRTEIGERGINLSGGQKQRVRRVSV